MHSQDRLFLWRMVYMINGLQLTEVYAEQQISQLILLQNQSQQMELMVLYCQAQVLQ